MRLKALVKCGVGKLSQGVFLRQIVKESARRSYNVVYYHYIGEPPPHYFAFYAGCTIDKFESDLLELGKVFEFAPLDDVINSGPSLTDKRPLLAVTFDDGFDLYRSGVSSTLERFGVRATTFVVTSCLGNRSLMWRHKLSVIRSLVPERVWRPAYQNLALEQGFEPLAPETGFMEATKKWSMAEKDSWADDLWNSCNLEPVEDYLAKASPYFTLDSLKKWISDGHTVGFHTHTHPFCSRLALEDLQSEFINPATHLREILGLRTVPVSYPFGDKLSADLERTLLDSGKFSCFFGIKGFTRQSERSPIALERANLESSDVGWAVFSRHAFGRSG